MVSVHVLGMSSLAHNEPSNSGSPDALDPVAATGGTSAAGLSRRALLLAAASVVIAGCGSRKSMDPMAGVARHPAPGRPNRTTPPNTSPAPAPSMPAKPGVVAGNGYVVVKRSSWTNQPVKGNNNPMGAITRITVHHTGEHGNWADLPDVEIVQRIESYHRNEKDWAAIGYHFLVGKDGRIYEGRPVKYQGAHVSTQNENNLGISVIGDYTDHQPSARQLEALNAFLNDKRKAYGVGRARIYGHRDLHASLCPGDSLYAWVKKYKIGQA